VTQIDNFQPSLGHLYHTFGSKRQCKGADHVSSKCQLCDLTYVIGFDVLVVVLSLLLLLLVVVVVVVIVVVAAAAAAVAVVSFWEELFY